MISVTSVTDSYVLQPSLLARHKATLDWLSATILWNKEMAFFQKMLEEYSDRFTDREGKEQIDHFQSIIVYYKGELLINLGHKLRLHEKKLADMLETRDETKIAYFKEHDGLMNELEDTRNQMAQYKEELFSFIEKVM